MQTHLTERLPARHARLQREGRHEYCAGVGDLAVATAHPETLAENR